MWKERPADEGVPYRNRSGGGRKRACALAKPREQTPGCTSAGNCGCSQGRGQDQRHSGARLLSKASESLRDKHGPGSGGSKAPLAMAWRQVTYSLHQDASQENERQFTQMTARQQEVAEYEGRDLVTHKKQDQATYPVSPS